MPIDLDLKFRKTSTVLHALGACPGLFSRGEPLALKLLGLHALDVRWLALEESIYGEKAELPDETRAFLAAFRHERIFEPKDLFRRKGAHAAVAVRMIGTWNLDFLKWLKHAARAAQTTLSVDYMHERGDWPYESAYWSFNFERGATVVECFGMRNWDSDPWSAGIARLSDGRVFRKPE